MMKDILPPEAAERVAVFPLPEFVLFPHTLIPFHIFEPRYRDMVATVLAGSRMIVVVGLEPGWENDYFSTPPVYLTGSIGKVVNDERLADGRYNIFVHGLSRVVIERWHQEAPYRVATVRFVADELREAEPSRVADVVQRLRGLSSELARQLGDNGRAVSKVLVGTSDASILTNRLASLLVHDAGSRQELLETLDPLERAERLIDLFGRSVLDGLELRPRAAGDEDDDDEAGPRWIN
jgi:Lon protease-like protein